MLLGCRRASHTRSARAGKGKRGGAQPYVQIALEPEAASPPPPVGTRIAAARGEGNPNGFVSGDIACTALFTAHNPCRSLREKSVWSARQVTSGGRRMSGWAVSAGAVSQGEGRQRPLRPAAASGRQGKAAVGRRRGRRRGGRTWMGRRRTRSLTAWCVLPATAAPPCLTAAPA